MLGMKHPCWTGCLIMLWIALLPATLMTHVAVGRLVPGISDLPDNLIKGFDTIFGFASLTADAQKIAVNAKSALALCDASYNTHETNSTPAKTQPGCAASPKTGQGAINGAKDKNIFTQEQGIDAAFANSLATIEKVTSDKYLGVPEFNATAQQLKQLDKARKDMKAQLTGTVLATSGNSSERKANCYTIAIQMCAMDAQAVLLQNGIGKVRAEIDKLTNSDIVKKFKENKGYIQALHAMPYVLMIGMVMFTLFWWCGGVCCCCRKGTIWGCLFIPLFLVMWLVAFIMWAVIFGIGFAIKNFSNQMKIKELNGDPSVHDLTKHLETNFAQFWNTVFKDLYDGCVILYPASVIFLLVCIFIALYACCECCCCPYRKDMEEHAKGGPVAKIDGNQA